MPDAEVDVGPAADAEELDDGLLEPEAPAAPEPFAPEPLLPPPHDEQVPFCCIECEPQLEQVPPCDPD